MRRLVLKEVEEYGCCKTGLDRIKSITQAALKANEGTLSEHIFIEYALWLEELQLDDNKIPNESKTRPIEWLTQDQLLTFASKLRPLCKLSAKISYLLDSML